MLSFISFKSLSYGGEDGRLPYGFPDSTVKVMLTVLDLKYSKTPLFTKMDDQYLFYVCKGTWVDTTKSKGKSKALMGIVNEKQELILPVEYTKLYTPDATTRGYIEIEKNGKRGLVNYHTKKIIPCDYDVIYPSDDWTSIAIGKIYHDFYYLYATGKRELITDKYFMIGSWNINISRETSPTLLYDSYPKKKREDDDDNYFWYQATGVYITPSYLLSLKYLPAVFNGVDIKGNFQEGITDIKSEIKDSHHNKNIDLYSLITSFKYLAIEGRGEVIDRNYILLKDKHGSVRDYGEITEDNNAYLYFIDDGNESNDGIFTPIFINDSIVQLHYTTDTVLNFSKYDHLTQFSYYKINRTAKVEKLESNRIFDMTKFVVMGEEHFKGSFIKDMKTDDNKGMLSKSLDLEDLDLMRNEIYADYGLKFKTEKWNTYFSKQAWYTPKYDNVEAYLTEIDKANMKLILSYQENLKNSELLITQPKVVTYWYGW